MLYIAQPNLSRSIRRLEEEIGIVLFSRKSNGVFPTPKGEAFLRSAEPYVEGLDALINSCKQEKGQDCSISVAVQSTLLYINTLNNLSEKNGGCIKIKYCTFPDIVDCVANNTVTLSFVLIPEPVVAGLCQQLAQRTWNSLICLHLQ